MLDGMDAAIMIWLAGDFVWLMLIVSYLLPLVATGHTNAVIFADDIAVAVII